MPPRPAHIVIVEDEPVTRSALASYLESFGYRVSECDTAEKAEAIAGVNCVRLGMIGLGPSSPSTSRRSYW